MLLISFRRVQTKMAQLKAKNIRLGLVSAIGFCSLFNGRGFAYKMHFYH